MAVTAAEMNAECLLREDWQLPPEHAERVEGENDGAYPYTRRMRGAAYQRQLQTLQIELVKLHSWIKDTRQRVVVLFEGRDAAGKGGAIKRFAEHLNPRHARVVCLDKPTEAERGQWYFQRYIEQLPTAGEIVMFDRSWYNRAGVERVMGFCGEDEYWAFFQQALDLERNLIASGTHLIKLWFDVSREEQLRRMWARSSDPLKQWKLSPIDLTAIDKWGDYSNAESIMFARTARTWSPWARIRSDCKRRARIEALRHVPGRFDYPDARADVIAATDLLLLTVIAHAEADSG